MPEISCFSRFFWFCLEFINCKIEVEFVSFTLLSSDLPPPNGFFYFLNQFFVFISQQGVETVANLEGVITESRHG